MIFFLSLFTYQTDEKVDTEEALVQSVRVAMERLGDYEGRSLIQWAQEQFGPLASYSDIQLANRISLYIDGAGKHTFLYRVTINDHINAMAISVFVLCTQINLNWCELVIAM